jgi:hypothetical protein
MPLFTDGLGAHNHLNSSYVYDRSGIPFPSGTSIGLGEIHTVRFDYVTKWVMVRNFNAPRIALGVTSNGLSNGQYILLDSGTSSPQLDWRLSELFISGVAGSGRYEIVAGTTTIESADYPSLSGSNSQFRGYTGV